ncbi:MAG: hypothetical protein AVDCRST_MAG45-375, partial [uncultured Solirubrobacterales bacterium]
GGPAAHTDRGGAAPTPRRAGRYPRAGAGPRQSPPRAAARGRQRRRAAQGLVARAGGNGDPPRHVRPLVGPHPDRPQRGSASVPAARAARDRARDGHRPRHARARRRGGDRLRLPVARHRHVDPPRRPRAVQPVPGRRRASRAAGGPLRGARAHDRRLGGAARHHRPPPQRRAADPRGRGGARGGCARPGQGSLAGAVRVGAAEHPLPVGRGHRRRQDRGWTGASRTDRDRHEQLVGDLPGRRAAGHQAARLAARGAPRGRGPHRRRAREAARAGLSDL